jgi:hypothetical protein
MFEKVATANDIRPRPYQRASNDLYRLANIYTNIRVHRRVLTEAGEWEDNLTRPRPLVVTGGGRTGMAIGD